jgi:hypothetical protein
VRVGVPELVTNRGPLHPMKRFPWAPPRVEASYCILMSHARTESDLENLEILSMLCVSPGQYHSPVVAI